MQVTKEILARLGKAGVVLACSRHQCFCLSGSCGAIVKTRPLGLYSDDLNRLLTPLRLLFIEAVFLKAFFWR